MALLKKGVIQGGRKHDSITRGAVMLIKALAQDPFKKGEPNTGHYCFTGPSKPRLKFYPIPGGWRVKAIAGGDAQDVFVRTDNPDATRQFLEQRWRP